VGCGAIGCELLKLFALLGVGRDGQVNYFNGSFSE
jgi:molybdopterin/thiamine biosynthesis adenylyltransferase